MSSTILLFGGNSEEKLVSVASAQNFSKRYSFGKLWFISSAGPVYEVTLAELGAHTRPFELEFKPSSKPFADSVKAALSKVDGATMFLGLHGSEGEDGTLQRMLEDARIPFTGSGSASSALCFNKLDAKQKAKAGGVPTAAQAVFQRGSATWMAKILTDFMSQQGAIAVKPVTSGSSFGLHMIEKPEQVMAACESIAKSPYTDYMAEKMLRGRELTVGVIDSEKGLMALPPSEVVLNQGHSFDYEGKYLGRGTTEITPADLTEPEKKAAQNLALTAHKVLGCYGYSRTDMILTPTGPVILETNTLPGMTAASFIPQQLTAAGIEVPAFIERQLELARKR